MPFLYFSPNLPLWGLKMTVRMIPNDFWNSKFFTFFRFGGIPETPKKFFSKIIFFKIFHRSQFSIFFDGTGLKWKIFQFRTYWQREMLRFSLTGVPRTPSTKVVTPRSLFWNFSTSSKIFGPNHAKSQHFSLSVCAINQLSFI